MRSLKASKPFSVNGFIILLPFFIKRSIKDFRTAKISRIIFYDKIIDDLRRDDFLLWDNGIFPI